MEQNLSGGHVKYMLYHNVARVAKLWFNEQVRSLKYEVVSPPGLEPGAAA